MFYDRSPYDPARPSFLRRFLTFLRGLLPGGLTLVLVLISVAPSRLPGLSQVVPMVALTSVYFWAVTRPGSMGYVVAFLIGLVGDSLTGVPLGTNAIILLLVQALIESQAKFFSGQSFLVAWSAFVPVVLAACFLKWLIVSAVYMRPMGITALLFSGFLTIALFPLFAWVFGWILHVLFRDEA